MTSLTVPPSALRMPRTSWNDMLVHATRRLPPIGRFQGALASGLRAAGSATSSARASFMMRWICSRGSSMCCWNSVNARKFWPAWSKTASDQDSSGDGGSLGRHGCAGGGVGSGSGTRSSTASSNSMPETPSTRQWCTRLRYAVRSPSIPWMTVMSQSGRSRGSMPANISLQRSMSCACVPGGGSVTSRRWRSSEKAGSSSHVGCPAKNGGITARWR